MSFPVVLFDIDGTLTEPRQVISTEMVNSLVELSKLVEIGFLTGSDLEYVKQQMWPAFERKLIRDNCHILPCNGTQYYIPAGNNEFKAVYRTDMFNALGYETFQTIMKIICKLQAEICSTEDMPLTGHFVQNRDSTINWCPIGRNANNGDRQQFVSIDRLQSLRNSYFLKFKKELFEAKINNVEVKLGGSTSFDIFPTGWDKTFALKHFSIETEFWFLGDKCRGQGNDVEIYELLANEHRAFEVSSPYDTITVINNLIDTEFYKYE